MMDIQQARKKLEQLQMELDSKIERAQQVKEKLDELENLTKELSREYERLMSYKTYYRSRGIIETLESDIKYTKELIKSLETFDQGSVPVFSKNHTIYNEDNTRCVKATPKRLFFITNRETETRKWHIEDQRERGKSFYYSSIYTEDLIDYDATLEVFKEKNR